MSGRNFGWEMKDLQDLIDLFKRKGGIVIIFQKWDLGMIFKKMRFGFLCVL